MRLLLWHFRAGLIKIRTSIKPGNLSFCKDQLSDQIETNTLHDYLRWTGQDDAQERVIALPYQRFSDHIIARHLLAHHLDKTNELSIRASLLPGTPIGRVFELRDDWSKEYENTALAEALIIEFPETAKKKIDEGERELYFYLPENSKDLNAYFRPFIDGFSWRSPATIDASTERIIATLIDPNYPEAYRLMIDVLIMVATKPKHPLSAERLLAYLKSLSMPDRDLSWSEALRNMQPGSSIDRVVQFYSEVPLKSMTYEVASLSVTLLASFLTTTNRLLRDKATLGLVRVGELQPACLFAFAETALEFNDPYVAERVLAAIYGATMSLWRGAGDSFKSSLHSLVVFLVKEMFAPGGRFRTCHVLTRDYALGIIEISKLVVPGAIHADLELYLGPPFSAIQSPFPEARKISARTVKKVTSSIHMDFGNYTLGRLIEGRSNYDYANPTYKTVRRQIEWRMANLGYDSEKFKKADESIERSQSHSRGDNAKINRYGKKYSWIAYFEMYGLRQAQGLIDINARSGDCDIDPSFPIKEYISTPKKTDFFSKKRLPKGHARWLKSGPAPDYSSLLRLDTINGDPGPWRLLCGYINETDPKSLHQLWAQIHAFLVHNEQLNDLGKEFMKSGFPPHELSHVSEDHYTYAGEISWSKRFGSRQAIGGNAPNTVTAYIRREQEKITEPLKKGWSFLDPHLVKRFFESSSELAKKRNRNSLQRHLDKINAQLSPDDQLTIYEITNFQQYPSEVAFLTQQTQRMVWVNSGGIEVEPLGWSFAWENYHSELNQVQFYLPTPSFCEEFNLNTQARSIGLFEPSGVRATYYMRDGDNHTDRTTLLYVREELLHRYAEKRGKRIVFLSWGEREIHHSIAQGFWNANSRSENPTIEEIIFKHFQSI